jgi:hypothetical protein
MRRYVVHDLRGGLREPLDDLSELPEFMEWAEAEYPGISGELMIRAFDGDREVAPSSWATDALGTLRESRVVRTGRWRSELALTVRGFGTGWSNVFWSFRPQIAATETPAPRGAGTGESRLPSLQRVAS